MTGAPEPFNPRELMARVQAMLRRARPLGTSSDTLEGARTVVRTVRGAGYRMGPGQ